MVDIAYAADAAQASGNPLAGFIPMILIFVVFYFLLIRPQQKKAKTQQEFLSNLKKGDEVVSGGGLHGKITGITDSVVTLEIADNLRVKVSRQYILSPVSSMTAGSKDASCSPSGG
ncbi:MAG: preprotein translocase subunit YajC [Desulfobulbaceae bacterium]|uniref:Sec translocon accessory complex subunit YajC n=1 Tax=Candidatus Desulfobia pelagia TaxID=2841692 RepID=A0A8J6NDB4_9BACT|nr:preprotein translocase subunit YajC [Candidatus Desulfobia pelagia]